MHDASCSSQGFVSNPSAYLHIDDDAVSDSGRSRHWSTLSRGANSDFAVTVDVILWHRNTSGGSGLQHRITRNCYGFEQLTTCTTFALKLRLLSQT